MDVRCDRCKTEYEFEDAKITEAGVTVKCTNCGHVFKVKKRAVLVTLPVSSEEASRGSDGAGKREWRVRQANGNVFTFKELTTLQKWIVERKVSRDDEISLTGESWKRLGNIAELASFFQVVEAADRATTTPSAAGPAPVGYALGTSPTYVPGVSGVPVGPGAVPAIFTPQPQPAYLPPAAPQGPTSGFAPLPAPQAGWEAPPPRRRTYAEDEILLESELKAAGLGTGAWKWLLLVVMLAGAGAGVYFGYTRYFRPAQAPPPPPPPVEEKKPEPPPQPPAPVAEEKKPEPPPEPPKAVEPPKKPAEAAAPRTYEGFLAIAERLRGKNKAKEALEFFGRAADLKPEGVEAIAGKGLCFIDMEMYPQAVASFEKALEINERYGEAIMGMGEAYKFQEDKPNAIKWYERYIEVVPDGPEASVAKTNLERLKE